MRLFHREGPRTKRLVSHLRRRSLADVDARAAGDAETWQRLGRRRAVVFTDTASFTRLVESHGILHFLMLFARTVAAAAPAIATHGGEIVKVEGDSLLLRFDAVGAACRAVLGMERALARLRRGAGPDQSLAFSYGIGFGDVLDLERDLFGLEVNLASKLGEDLARPGEILLTPAAGAALSPALAKKTRSHGVCLFSGRPLRIRRLIP